MWHWGQFCKALSFSMCHLYPTQPLPSFETEVVNQAAGIDTFADFFITVFEAIWVERSPHKLFRINELRAKAFSRFWLAVCRSSL
jgi:hypothetical protein